jgi:hypothetical protein
VKTEKAAANGGELRENQNITEKKKSKKKK